MKRNEYHFVTRWRVPGTLEEVAAIIADGPGLTRWWPSVYLDVQELEPGDASGVGRVISLYTKGWLPYTLRWRFRVTEVLPGRGFALDAWGDFVGRGIWRFEPDGEWTNVIYDWRVRAEKPLLRRFSWALKPVFAANHRWAMAMGERSLLLEIARSRARTTEERARIPPPPGPTTTPPVPLLLGGVAALAAAAAALRANRRVGTPAGEG